MTHIFTRLIYNMPAGFQQPCDREGLAAAHAGTRCGTGYYRLGSFVPQPPPEERVRRSPLQARRATWQRSADHRRGTEHVRERLKCENSASLCPSDTQRRSQR